MYRLVRDSSHDEPHRKTVWVEQEFDGQLYKRWAIESELTAPKINAVTIENALDAQMSARNLALASGSKVRIEEVA